MQFIVNSNGSSSWGPSNISSGARGGGSAPKQSSDNSALDSLVRKTVDEQGLIPDTAIFMEKQGIKYEELDPVLKSLVSLDCIVLEVIERKAIELTDEGKSYAVNGSPEYQFVSNMVMGEKVDMAEMESRVGGQIAKIGFGKAMKQKWVKKNGNELERIAESPVDVDKDQLQKFIADPNPDSHEKKVIDNYKKRKHLNVKSTKSYKVTKGADF